MIVMPACFNVGDTIYFPFDTYDSAGASVTITGLAVTDIEIYKNGGTTQRSSDAGIALLDTDGIDFDGATGFHGFSVDTSDNTDAGFWTDGAQYFVVVNSITVDGQVVLFSYLLPLGYSLRPTTKGRQLDVSTGGEAGIDWGNVGSPTTAVGLSGTTVGLVDGALTDAKIASGAITTAKIATDAISADAVSAAAVTKVQDGLATPTNITAGTITNVTNLTNAAANGDLTEAMKASVNAQVLDVLNVDTFAEPGQGAPAATTTLQHKIAYIYKWAKNKVTQTETTQSLYAADGTTVDHKRTVSDDGTTTTLGEIVSGP